MRHYTFKHFCKIHNTSHITLYISDFVHFTLYFILHSSFFRLYNLNFIFTLLYFTLLFLKLLCSALLCSALLYSTLLNSTLDAFCSVCSTSTYSAPLNCTLFKNYSSPFGGTSRFLVCLVYAIPVKSILLCSLSDFAPPPLMFSTLLCAILLYSSLLFSALSGSPECCTIPPEQICFPRSSQPGFWLHALLHHFSCTDDTLAEVRSHGYVQQPLGEIALVCQSDEFVQTHCRKKVSKCKIEQTDGCPSSVATSLQIRLSRPLWSAQFPCTASH